jgi:hypothetical protein
MHTVPISANKVTSEVDLKEIERAHRRWSVFRARFVRSTTKIAQGKGGNEIGLRLHELVTGPISKTRPELCVVLEAVPQRWGWLTRPFCLLQALLARPWI